MTPTAHTSLTGYHLARQHSGARYLWLYWGVGGMAGIRGGPALNTVETPPVTSHPARQPLLTTPDQATATSRAQPPLRCSPGRALWVESRHRQLLGVEEDGQTEIDGLQGGGVVFGVQQELQHAKRQQGEQGQASRGT